MGVSVCGSRYLHGLVDGLPRPCFFFLHPRNRTLETSTLNRDRGIEVEAVWIWVGKESNRGPWPWHGPATFVVFSKAVVVSFWPPDVPATQGSGLWPWERSGLDWKQPVDVGSSFGHDRDANPNQILQIHVMDSYRVQSMKPLRVPQKP